MKRLTVCCSSSFSSTFGCYWPSRLRALDWCWETGTYSM